MIGLLIRGDKRKSLQQLPVNNHQREHQIPMLTTLLAAYYISLSLVMSGLTQRLIDTYAVLDGITMIIHVTFQTLLMRSDWRKLEKLKEIFAFLILSTFSLWVLEISETASIITDLGLTRVGISILPNLFVALNRFYVALVFIKFWKIK